MRTKQGLRACEGRARLNGRLAAYLTAAGAVGTVMASEAEAVIVSSDTVQPFGINGAVSIDFNGDTQIDYQIDHDRVDLGGGNLVDYLQVDKNDTNGASPGEDPLLIPGIFDAFPGNGHQLNSTFEAGYLMPTATQGDYPAALSKGGYIGSGASFDWQETDGFQGSKTIRANRLMDEDAGQVDMTLGGTPPANIAVPTNGPNFGGGDIQYLGVKMQLQGNPNPITYGWIGIRITNDADATGEVVGWAYETSGAAIRAGQVPEPTGIITALGGLMMVGCLMWRRLFGRR